MSISSVTVLFVCFDVRTDRIVTFTFSEALFANVQVEETCSYARSGDLCISLKKKKRVGTNTCAFVTLVSPVGILQS